MMTYKLKHLSKFCCIPIREIEFKAVKMAAEIGGVNWYPHFDYSDLREYEVIRYNNLNGCIICHTNPTTSKFITVDEYINKLLMTEEEAEKLEDDRVELGHSIGLVLEWSTDYKSMKTLNGHYFKTNDDGTEVTLHKKDC